MLRDDPRVKWMMTAVIATAIWAVAAVSTFGEEQPVTAHLQTISVTIESSGSYSIGRSQGSGVVFHREDETWVWTAAHVVDGQRRTRKVVDPRTGTERTVVWFDDAKIIKHLFEEGRTVGKIELFAEVVRYSDANNGEDLALLKMRKSDYIKDSVEFYLDEKIPAIGSRLWHVGSLLGEQGSNSLTAGIMSQHGRLISGSKVVYDQTTVTAFPGSSGGGVYLEDGRYVGMLVRGAGEGFNLIVPVRRMRAWAEQAGVLWAIDRNVKMPSAEEREKIPVEDIGVIFERSSTKPGTDAPIIEPPKTLHSVRESEFGFLIREF